MIRESKQVQIAGLDVTISARDAADVLSTIKALDALPQEEREDNALALSVLAEIVVDSLRPAYRRLSWLRHPVKKWHHWRLMQIANLTRELSPRELEFFADEVRTLEGAPPVSEQPGETVKKKVNSFHGTSPDASSGEKSASPLTSKTAPQ